MSNYKLHAIIPPSLVAQEKKAARKKLLEEVGARRKEMHKRLRERMQHALQQAGDDMI